MALINRITRLFRADMHAVLDRLEEPDILLKQAIREMAEDIADDEQKLKQLENEQGYLQERLQEITENLNQMEEELALCFDANNDDLARNLVKRKLELQRFDKFLNRKGEALEKNAGELQQRLQENRTRLQAMQQKQELLMEQTSRSSDDPGLNPDLGVTDDEVEVAFLREQQKRQAS